MNELNQQLIQEARWHRIAYVDALTGLKNRMAYIERINELSRQQMSGKRVWAVMMDLDDFKNINDTFGHHAGDHMIQHAAGHMASVFADDCYEAFRIGGDEFAVIAIGITVDQLEKTLERLNAQEGDRICRFSWGYAEVIPTENNAMENAFIRADANMYAQKKLFKTAAGS